MQSVIDSREAPAVATADMSDPTERYRSSNWSDRSFSGGNMSDILHDVGESIKKDLRHKMTDAIEKALNKTSRGNSSFNCNWGNGRNRFQRTRTNTGEAVCLCCWHVGHTARVCTWRDPRIPNNRPPFPNQSQARDHIASTGYQSRGNFLNSSVGRQFASANLAVRGRGSSSLSRGSSGRGSSSSSHFRTDDSRLGKQNRSQQQGRYFGTPRDDPDYYVSAYDFSSHLLPQTTNEITENYSDSTCTAIALTEALSPSAPGGCSIMILAMLHNIPVKCLVDTGAAVTGINVELWKKYPRRRGPP